MPSSADAPNERRPRLPPGLGRGKDGVHVEPGPDGRGKLPEQPQPMRQRLKPSIIGAIFLLLALNYVIAASFNRPAPSVRVPYSPTFLQQVEAGNVKRISSEGTTVDGEFKKAVKYPPTSKDEAAKNFETEIPTFVDDAALERTLRENDVEIAAEPINQGPGILVNLLLGFGPILLIIGLFVYFARRAARQGGGMNPLG